ncbi:MAG: MFS transporter [Pseudomonadota bacterium]
MRGLTAPGSVQANRRLTTVDCSERQKLFVLIVAILGSALGFMDGSIVSIIAPDIRGEFYASLASISWLVNGYTLVLTAFILIGGAAGDAYGKRRIFAWGIGIFAAASLVCAVAPSIGALIAARIVQGFGAALMVPLSMALIATYYPREERGRAVGIWAAASAVSAALGPLVGGVMVDSLGWRSTFYINLPLAAVTLWLLLARVPDDSHTCRPRSLDWTGGLLASASLGLIALSLTVLTDMLTGDGITSAAVFLVGGSLALGLIMGAAFIWVEARAEHPMMPLGLFRLNGFAAVNLATFFLYAALGGLLFFLPVTFISAFDAPAVSVAALFVPFTVIMALLTPRVGTLVDRIGVRWPLAGGSLIAACAFVASWPAVASGSLWAVGLTMALLGLGMALCIPPLSTAVLNAVDDSQTGVASGINNAVSRAGGLVAVAVFAPLGALSYGAADALPGFGASASGDASAAVIEAHKQASFAGYGALSLAATALAVLAAFIILVKIPAAKADQVP